MTQNIYIPESWDNYTSVETVYGSLGAPYNPDKVAELVNAQFSIPPVGYMGCGPEDTLIAVYLPNPVTPEEIAAALAKLNAICTDPTRNNLTAEQQEAAENAVQEAVIRAHLDALAGLPADDKAYALMGRMFAVNDGASQAVISGIVDRNTAKAYVTAKPQWSNLTAASKIWEGQSLDMLAKVFQIMLLNLPRSQ